MTTSTAIGTFRELAHRINAGIEVVLSWNDGTGRLKVSVLDEQSGAYFELDPDPAIALDVFDHPFAYAAFDGVPYDTELLPMWAHASAQTEVVTAAGR